jgi:hypothetical protein
MLLSGSQSLVAVEVCTGVVRVLHERLFSPKEWTIGAICCDEVAVLVVYPKQLFIIAASSGRVLIQPLVISNDTENNSMSIFHKAIHLSYAKLYVCSGSVYVYDERMKYDHHNRTNSCRIWKLLIEESVEFYWASEGAGMAENFITK